MHENEIKENAKRNSDGVHVDTCMYMTTCKHTTVKCHSQIDCFLKKTITIFHHRFLF